MVPEARGAEFGEGGSQMNQMSEAIRDLSNAPLPGDIFQLGDNQFVTVVAIDADDLADNSRQTSLVCGRRRHERRIAGVDCRAVRIGQQGRSRSAVHAECAELWVDADDVVCAVRTAKAGAVIRL